MDPVRRSRRQVKVAMQRHLFGFGSAVDVRSSSPGLARAFPRRSDALPRVGPTSCSAASFPRTGSASATSTLLPIPHVPGRHGPTPHRHRGAMDPAVGAGPENEHPRPLPRLGLRRTLARKALDSGECRTARHLRPALPLRAPLLRSLRGRMGRVEPSRALRRADALYHIVGKDFYPDIYRKIRPLTGKTLFVNEDTFIRPHRRLRETHPPHDRARRHTRRLRLPEPLQRLRHPRHHPRMDTCRPSGRW